MAISEPGAGAHPKHLTTEARRDGNDFVLNGEKAYLTNGPMADIFLVLAITGHTGNRKQFSVLIVPRDAAGLELTDGVKIDYLRPSPHCGIKLHDVRVPVANLLGPEGEAFDAIRFPCGEPRMPFSQRQSGCDPPYPEWHLHGSTVAGTRQRQCCRIGKIGRGQHGIGRPSLSRAELLNMRPHANADAVGAIAASAREWASSLHERITALIDSTGLVPSPMLAAACRDLEKSLGIARGAYVIQARRRGSALFH